MVRELPGVVELSFSRLLRNSGEYIPASVPQTALKFSKLSARLGLHVWLRELETPVFVASACTCLPPFLLTVVPVDGRTGAVISTAQVKPQGREGQGHTCVQGQHVDIPTTSEFQLHSPCLARCGMVTHLDFSSIPEDSSARVDLGTLLL